MKWRRSIAVSMTSQISITSLFHKYDINFGRKRQLPTNTVVPSSEPLPHLTPCSIGRVDSDLGEVPAPCSDHLVGKKTCGKSGPGQFSNGRSVPLCCNVSRPSAQRKYHVYEALGISKPIMSYVWIGTTGEDDDSLAVLC